VDAAAYAGHSRAVADTFVGAYPEHLRSRMRELGLDPEDFAGSIDAGRAQLEAAFVDWVDLGPTTQRSSPLELLRNALVPPTEAMRAAGVASRDRDELQQRSLPGDIYDLAPATSQELGEAAFRAHVAWGIARAEAVAGMVPAPPGSATPGSATPGSATPGATAPGTATPGTTAPGMTAPGTTAPGTTTSASAGRRTAEAVAALVATDLMDRTRITETATRVGYVLELWRNPAAVAEGLAHIRPLVAFVDLRHAAAHEAIRLLVAAGVHTVVYGPHVDDMAMAAARALGAAEVLPRSRFFARLPSMFPDAV
jgi:hypothetical protein